MLRQHAASLARPGRAASGGRTRLDRQLRVMDIVLTLVAAAVLALPLLLSLAFGRLRGTPHQGIGGRPFRLWQIDLPGHAVGRLLRRLGGSRAPVVFNVLSGDMAWVGPRPLPYGEAEEVKHHAVPCPLAVRPGVVNLWRIRRRTAVDFGTEADSELEYLQSRGVRHDLGVLARAVAAKCFRLAPVMAEGEDRARERVRVCDVLFDNVNVAQALEQLRHMLEDPATQTVSFVNASCVNTAASNRGYRHALGRAALVLPDGIGIKIAGDLLGQPLRQNVNGTDLFAPLCDLLAARRARIYLLGGQPGVAEQTARVVSGRWPALQVVGWRDGYFGTAEEGDVVAQVRASRADVLLVARGVPTQDVFIDRHRHHLGVRVAMGVGALFDFVSGRVDRAPRWMREIGLEWAWRLGLEPARLWRRYLVGNVTFLLRVLLQRSGWRRLPAAADALDPPRAATMPPTVRAVLFATRAASGTLPVPADLPAACLPLGAMSFAERVIGQLARAGVSCIDVVACDRPEALRRLLGNGERWGVTLSWHLVHDPHRPYGVLRSLPLHGCRRVLIGHADVVLGPAALQGLLQADRLAIMEATDGDGPRWGGWASLHTGSLASVSHDCDEAALGRALAVGVDSRLTLNGGDLLRCDSAAALLHAQDAALSDRPALACPPGWTPTAWGAMGPRAVVDPRAVVHAPAFIGPGCYVGAGAIIGPGTVLAQDVIVSGGSSVVGSLVLPSTLIGALVELRRCVAQGRRIHNARLGVDLVLPASDAVMVDMRPEPVRQPSWPGRGMAVIALALLAPLWMVDAAVRRWGPKSDDAARGPRWRKVDTASGRPFAGGLLHTVPLRWPQPAPRVLRSAVAMCGPLMDVIDGRRCWFGVRPRSPSAWGALPPEWQTLLAKAPIGCWHAPAWRADAATRPEAEAAADAFYAVRPGLRERLRIVRHGACAWGTAVRRVAWNRGAG